MSAPVGPQAEEAVQRLARLVASGSLARADRLRAAQAVVVVLEGGDPAAALRTAGEVEWHRPPTPVAPRRNAAPARGGRVRRGLRAVGDLLDVLTPW